jgi:coenzyme PQQ precursor peptide PqqA
MAMNWETPSFVELRMDAEINAYQDEFREVPGGDELPVEIPVSTHAG